MAAEILAAVLQFLSEKMRRVDFKNTCLSLFLESKAASVVK